MRAKPFFTALAYFCVSGLCTLGGLMLRNYWHLNWDWNWLGKGLEIVFALGFIGLHPQLNYVSVGLTKRVRSLGPVMIGGLLVVGFQAAVSLFLGEDTGFSKEELAYQATMPGLAEEIGFRGVLLTLFNRSFGQPFTLLGAHVGWGLVVQAVLFTFPHCLSPDLHLTLWGLTTFPAALAFGWMTERSGSLLPAIVTHNVGNALLQFL